MNDFNTIISETCAVLNQGGLILYPTDTIWGVGCDATNFEAVANLYKLKERDDRKSMICLVNDLMMLNHYVEEIPEIALDLLKNTHEPTTIIYENPDHISKNLIALDNTLAIRLVKEPFCNSLIKKFGKPIVSTSANLSGQPSPKNFREISEDILKGVDYVVNLHREKKVSKPSSIIKISGDGTMTVIRK